MDNSWAIDEFDKTKTFKTHLNDVFKPHASLGFSDFYKNIEKSLYVPLQKTLHSKLSLQLKSSTTL